MLWSPTEWMASIAQGEGASRISWLALRVGFSGPFVARQT